MASAVGMSVSVPAFVPVSCSTCVWRQSRGGVAVRCQQKEQEGVGEVSRREMVAGGAAGVSFLVSLAAGRAAFGLLEPDEDESLLEKLKAERQKKLQRRVEVKSFVKEAESVQAAVYELSKVGQALDGSDFSAASNVLGSSDVSWISDVKAALSKVSSSPEEENEAAAFASALLQLQSAVSSQNADESRNAFFVSATALEKWTRLAGVSDLLKGL